MALTTPTLAEHGFHLVDAEARAQAHPETFTIPALDLRRNLPIGSLAKLIFTVAVDTAAGTRDVVAERMWVVVRETAGNHYLGWLANEPGAANPAPRSHLALWAEIPFAPENVIDVRRPDAAWLNENLPAGPSRPWNSKALA